MADYPALGLTPWRDALKAYLDEQVSLAGAVDLGGSALWLYGNSYTLLTAYSTAAKHWSGLLAAKANGGAVTTYGIAGTRIVDVLGGMINGNPIDGSTGQTAGALWPGSSRVGPVFIDSGINDTAHYPAMNVSPAVPTDITSANTRYLDGLKGMYRAAIALASSASRVESAVATHTGPGWSAESAATYASGGSLRFTSTVGDKAAFSVTPPQSGPLAGKVFVLTYKLDASIGAMAKMTIDVDGSGPFDHTPTAWEQYTGPLGAAVNIAWECVAVTVPIDGSAHTVNVTHSGSGGQFLYSDAVLIPSEDPNPVVVMGAEIPAKVGVWTSPQAATYRRNRSKVATALKAVVAEFPNAAYAPSTMTENGLRDDDGLHPSLRGMAQRMNDALGALRVFKPKMDNYVLSLKSDSEF